MLWAHYTNELDRARRCDLSVSGVWLGNTQAIVAAAAAVTASLVLQTVETYVVTYASDGVLAAG